MLVSSDFIGDEPAARTYIALRAADAAKLMSEMQWAPGPITGTLQCRIYGHSVLWDVASTLHAWDHAGKYEVLFNGEDDPVADITLAEVLAMVLAKNW